MARTLAASAATEHLRPERGDANASWPVSKKKNKIQRRELGGKKCVILI